MMVCMHSMQITAEHEHELEEEQPLNITRYFILTFLKITSASLVYSTYKIMYKHMKMWLYQIRHAFSRANTHHPPESTLKVEIEY